MNNGILTNNELKIYSDILKLDIEYQKQYIENIKRKKLYDDRKNKIFNIKQKYDK